MEKFRGEKDEIFAAAGAALEGGDDAGVRLTGLSELLVRYSLLLRGAIAMVNTLVSERAAKAERFRGYARWARRATLSLYATGSVLAVVGAAVTNL